MRHTILNAVIYNIKESNKVPLIPLYAFVELTPLTDVSQAVFHSSRHSRICAWRGGMTNSKWFPSTCVS